MANEAPKYNEDTTKLALLMIATNVEAMKTDNERLAKLWGPTVTANGMRQRVQKIKSLAKQQLESMSENDPGASASANGATPKSGGKRKNGAAATSGEDDEQSGEKSPVKKAKSATKKGVARKSVKEAGEEKVVKKEKKAEDESALQIEGGADEVEI